MDTNTNLGLGLVVGLAVAGVMIAFAIVGILVNRIATQLENSGDF